MASILYGHHIVDSATRQSSWVDKKLSIESDKLVSLLRQHQNRFLSISHLLNGNFSHDGLFLTFDDAYMSFKTEVIPIIEKLTIPVLLFVRTDVLNGKIPYEILLAYLLESCEVIITPNKKRFRCNTDLEQDKSFQKLHKIIKSRSVKKRATYIKELYKINNMAIPKQSPIPFLTWQEVKELSNHPLVTIGAHTNSHPSLARSFRVGEYLQIYTSKKKIESGINQSVRYFSYPYGSHNFIARLIAKLSGYELAFGTQEKSFNTLDTKNMHCLPRVDLEKWIQN